MKKFNIGNYKLPHMNPIKQVVGSAGDRVLMDNDSLRSVQSFKDEFNTYMGREFKGNDERLGRIKPSQNYKEAMRELNEKYFDLERGKLRLVPTDDAEMQDEEFKSKLKPYQLFNPEMFSDQQPKDE